MKESSCINRENHEYQTVKKEWETVATAMIGIPLYNQSVILNHSAEILVCSKCGDVIDPFNVVVKL